MVMYVAGRRGVPGRRWTRRDSIVPNVPPASEDQLSEHVPWENLTIPPQGDRRFLVYGVAAGLVVAILGVVVVRQLDRPEAAEVLPVTSVSAATITAPPPETGPDPDPPAPPAAQVPLTAPEAPQEISEADLMAVDMGSVWRKVAARAEWIVLEFFTVDPSEPWRDRVERASGLRFPTEVAPDTPSVPTVSYVEWARTRLVEQTGADTFRASILIRRLVATDGVTFRRLPTEWVEVHLALEADGMVRGTGLPRITTPPQGNLLTLGEERLDWFTDSTGISWPSSPPPDTAGLLGL